MKKKREPNEDVLSLIQKAEAGEPITRTELRFAQISEEDFRNLYKHHRWSRQQGSSRKVHEDVTSNQKPSGSFGKLWNQIY